MVCCRLSLVDGEPLEKVGISGRLARVEQQVKKLQVTFARKTKKVSSACFISLSRLSCNCTHNTEPILYIQ